MKFIFFVLFVFSLCSGCSIKLKDMVRDNLSEIVDYVVSGEVDNIRITLMSGKRENIYKLNGISEELVPYSILTVCSNGNIDIKEVKYTIFVGVNKYEGIMENNPYDDSWVADLKRTVDYKENISVDIYIDDSKYSTKLNRIDNDWITNSTMIIDDILIANYEEQVKHFIKDNKFMGEVYLKLIQDYDKHSSRFYYYVSIQGRDNSSMSLLISPKTSEVLASNLIDTNN